MNWDEKAKEATRGRVYQFRGESWAFIEGSHWMRDQLRTDEAIERVARDLYVHSTVGATGKTWDLGSLIPKDAWRFKARAAITALLGEEP